ncbi:MAG TPA: TIR domain-containing protein, partial [Hyphomicrobiaceae bacterium]|nr:TIR domain-containing protein [Hyphomicrobiaceae bacterium]
MDQAAQVGSKLKVFISYSRQDLGFADQLVSFLEWQEFQAVIDRKGIHGAEKWEARLGQLILEADIVVFVLSPNSAASDVCRWEVEEADRRRKRIIPVLCRPLDGAQPPDRLRDLNYIYFYEEPDTPGSGFATGLLRLLDALSVDIDWVREHTRLEELATRWDVNGQPEDQLVRGSELAGYKAWRGRRPATAPELTDLQRNFLGASEGAEAARESAERRQLEAMAAAQAERSKALEAATAAQKRLAWRTRIGFVAAIALIVIAGAIGLIAFEQRRGLNLAERTLDLRQAYFQARAAGELLKDNQPVDAALIALEGMPDASDPQAAARPYVSDLSGLLISALRQFREQRVISGHGGRVNDAAFSPDGTRIVTASVDRTARIWAVATGQEIVRLEGHGGWVSSAAFSPDGTRIVTASHDKTARVWSAETGKEIAHFKGHDGAVYGAVFSPDGTRVVTASHDTTARVWSAATGKEIVQLKGHTQRVLGAVFSPDGTRIVTASADTTTRVWSVATGEEIVQLIGRTEIVQSAAFSPDGSRIVTASSRRVARLWEVATGKEIAEFKGHTGWVNSAVFSP